MGKLLRASAVSVVFFVVFGVVTALIPNPIYIRRVPRTPLDYTFLTVTSVLIGVYAAQTDLTRGASGAEDTSNDRLAFVGGALGFLSFGCPICNAVLLALFSNTAIMTYFDPLRPFLGVVSVVLLGGLVYYTYSSDCMGESCSPF
ncbi:MAG: hypothetical protein SV253_08805 [Halobacteria archaeon]|nr:hypothetical protein [Halobacteria archaeon]